MSGLVAAIEALHPGLTYLTAAFVLLALVLLRAVPKTEKRKVVTIGSLFLACLGVLGVARVLSLVGEAEAAAFLRGAAVYLEGACLIALVAVGLFRAVLLRLRVQLPTIVQDLVVAAAYLVWLFLWLQVNRVNLTGVIATSAVLTAVIGFSLQETLGNILGGVALQLDQSVRVGDWLRVDSIEGRVAEIRWRHTSLETPDGETIVIPNSALLKTQFRVLGRRQGQRTSHRRGVRFNVHDCHSPVLIVESVEKDLRSARIPGVAAEPRPECLLCGFTGGDVEYLLRYHLTEMGAGPKVDSEVRLRIYLALQRLGVPFAVPAQTVTLLQDSEAAKAEEAAERLAHRARVLARVDLFAGFHPDELLRLAERVVPAPFAPGEAMTQQGAAARWLYVLTEGCADVIVEHHRGHSTKVAELGPGEVFGEMGMMTGDPRRATVIARTQVECFRLDKESFEEIICSRPEVVEGISTLLARRRVELDAAVENLDQEAARARLANTQSDILGKVRSFFGIEH